MASEQKKSGDMTVREAGLLGGARRKEQLGPEGWAALDVGPTLNAVDCGKLKP